MKKLTVLLITIMSFQVFAGNFKASVDELVCGEMDPFIIGDACILHLTTEEQSKVALLMDFDEVVEKLQDGEIDGRSVLVFGDTLKKIRNPKVLRQLREFDRRYYYYLGSLKSFRLLAETEMETFIRALPHTHFYAGNLPQGYSSQKLEELDFNGNLKDFLYKELDRKLEMWQEYVLKGGEYDHLSLEERKAIAANPHKEFGVKYLLEVMEIHKIYKGPKFIGFYIEFNDYIQAAIYQDGAWIELYLNNEQQVVRVDHASA